MKLEKVLSQKRSVILKEWLDKIFDTYPAYSSRFLKKQKDRFANPIGYTLSNDIEVLYDELRLERGLDTEKVAPALDRIIRMRAIQDFSASGAVAFIYLLKDVVRERLKKEMPVSDIVEDLISFESKVDNLMLIAFDILVKCRERIYEIKANHARNQVSGLLRRAGLTSEIPEWEQYPAEDNNNQK
ncbi:MAG: RsbRD N-terminal domain-containing protein [Deltaproteobacteria bacterium]|nr:RsbRD N-terminal domain-containing protein [Deltaproteobacteria bacterium]